MSGNELIDFLSETKEIIEKYNLAIKCKEKEDGLNIFELISDKYHRENLHSDILHFLLNPVEKHQHDNLFLNSFIECLGYTETDYSAASVKKEAYTFDVDSQKRGFVDILITSNREKSTRGIIVENKINNAGDMPNQIPRYVSELGGIENVDYIVYISLEGNKWPDENWNCDLETKEKIRKKMVQFGATESKIGLHTWLRKCEDECRSEDVILIIKHYRKLLKKLRDMQLSPEAKIFYDQVTSDNKKYETALAIQNLMQNIGAYLASDLEQQFNSQKEYGPFQRVFTCGNDGDQLIFDQWKFRVSNYFLRVIFLNKSQQFIVELLDRERNWADKDHDRFKEKLSKLKFEETNDSWKIYVHFSERDKLVQRIELILRELKDIDDAEKSEIGQ